MWKIASTLIICLSVRQLLINTHLMLIEAAGGITKQEASQSGFFFWAFSFFLIQITTPASSVVKQVELEYNLFLYSGKKAVKRQNI